MEKYIFATDIHLNFIDRDPWEQNIGKFCDTVNALAVADNCKAMFIAGDISEAPYISKHMTMLAKHCHIPIYFVLGNHDFYKGKIDDVREQMEKLVARTNRKIVYLSREKAPCELEPGTFIVGHDGWYDGLYADWFAKEVVEMADYYHIRDIMPYAITKDRIAINRLLKNLAREGADFITDRIKELQSLSPKKIVILTHVPPWKESCLYEGKISNSSWLPNFSSRIMGDAIYGIAKSMPETEFHLYCGHTHSISEHAPAANIRAYTGFSEYGQPWASLKIIEL